eukprot:s759_g16.t1
MCAYLKEHIVFLAVANCRKFEDLDNSQDVNTVGNAGHVKWSAQNGFLREEGYDHIAAVLNSASMLFSAPGKGGVSTFDGMIPTREDLDWLLTHTTGKEAVTEEIPPEERLPVGGDTPCNNLRGCGAAQGKSFGAGTPWKNAEVKYCFDARLATRAKEAAQCAMRAINTALPGIRFTNVGSACNSKPAIFIQSSESGCWANIGMVQSNFFGFGGGQKLNLMTPGCDDCVHVFMFFYVFLHVCFGVTLLGRLAMSRRPKEFLHAMGVAHEQSRPDRDQYIVINWQNIKTGMESQFAIDRSADPRPTDVHRPYDIRSIMHYGPTSFTKNGQPTISVKAQGYALYTTNPSEYRRYRPGQRMAMSERDIEQLADLYDCTTPNSCMATVGPNEPIPGPRTVSPVGPGPSPYGPSPVVPGTNTNGGFGGGGLRIITPFNMDLSPDQITFFVLAAVAGSVICCALAGRFSHSGSVTNSLHKLQTQNLKWEVVSCGGTPPSPRCFHGACVANDLYVVFGGNESVDYSQPLNDLHLLDLRSGTWTCPNTNGEAPSPRFGHKMIHGPDNQIFVFGGSTGAAVPGSLHSFKLSTNTWCTVQVWWWRAVFPYRLSIMKPAAAGLSASERKAREEEMAAKRQKKEAERQRILAQAEADRRARMEPAVPVIAPTPVPPPSSAVAANSSVRLQLRCPQWSRNVIFTAFQSNNTLGDVRRALREDLVRGVAGTGDGRIQDMPSWWRHCEAPCFLPQEEAIVLAEQVPPRRKFVTAEDMQITLQAAGLCPSGTLLVDAAPIKAGRIGYEVLTYSAFSSVFREIDGDLLWPRVGMNQM